MSAELFRSVVAPRSSGFGRRVLTVPLSVAIHVAVLTLAVVIPLAAIGRPSLPAAQTIWVGPVVPPPPPPAPASASRAVALDRIAHMAAPTVPTHAPDFIGNEPGLVPPDDAPDPDALLASVGVIAGFGQSALDAPPPPPERPAPQQPVRISTGVCPPKRIHCVAPIYPDAARMARLEGLVIIEAVIDASGRVDRAHVRRGLPLLNDAALDAVRQWIYAPTRLNGQPVPVIMTVTVTFALK